MWSLEDVECGGVDVILVKDCKVCGHCGLVEQTDVSSGINYDDWILIGASRVGIEGCCASRVSEPGGVRQRLYERW
ncbi:hypothetical protein A2U01_0033057, partial [Trifolium medium]|nr:hypothetical protein [Trifolium medium]